MEVGDGERTLENPVLSVGAKHVTCGSMNTTAGVDGGQLRG
jgi:hypothetical protein